MSIEKIETNFIRKEINDLVQNYNQLVTNIVGIKMKTMQTDEIPVHQPPRRLAPKERTAVQ